eukprot:1261582-Rhodomonas_salina.2
MAETTRSTNTCALSVGLAAGSQSIPSGMLKTTNWSGIDAGLTHMLALGPHVWFTRASSVVCAGSEAVS